ncbi:hypothetical protein [Actinophytocola sp.]|uniref:hypothetical protein n=1 Tax=Actinophytocola sp. TaxID=1872138 RepID=UPI00389AB63A
MLTEIIQISRREKFDAVLIAGDIYETSAPSADAQKLVVRTLMELRATGAATFDAYRPLMAVAGKHLAGLARPAADGGVITFNAARRGSG